MKFFYVNLRKKGVFLRNFWFFYKIPGKRRISLKMTHFLVTFYFFLKIFTKIRRFLIFLATFLVVFYKGILLQVEKESRRPIRFYTDKSRFFGSEKNRKKCSVSPFFLKSICITRYIKIGFFGSFIGLFWSFLGFFCVFA